MNLAEQLPGFDRNPRKIKESERQALKRALFEYGDLGGIVFNVTTGHLVGGHQRVKDFSETEAQVTVTERLQQPDKVGTIAYGHIEIYGTKFSYREVAWDEQKEIAANLAANAIGGDWDTVKLQPLLLEMESEWFKKSGFDDELLKRLNLLQPPTEPQVPMRKKTVPQFGVMIMCESEVDQQKKLATIRALGLTCSPVKI